MSKNLSALLLQRAGRIHGQIVEGTRGLTDEQLARWLAPTAPSAAWHLWHISRWADRVHSVMPRMLADGDPSEPKREIWEQESIAARWGIDPTVLGYGQTGMEMGDKAAFRMTLPRNDTLQDYARRAFAAAEDVLSTVEDDQLQRRGRDLLYAGRLDRKVSVGEAILGHVTHAGRHLGSIEGLRGLLLEKPGSTTF